ncbi:MAG: hypothetical protein Q8Q09_06625 [Deltaproteobacteria bacterium]|nr:hypothetical protein [Deltaproteobacteria bacterium]
MTTVNAVVGRPPSPSPQDPELDQELLSLPAPPRARVRVLGALLGAISLVSVALAGQLADDTRFAFASSTPTMVGDARVAELPSSLANHVVRLQVTPQMAGAVRYFRPATGGDYLVYPVAGRAGEAVYVQVAGDAVRAGEITGRLVAFDGAGGRYARVGSFLREQLGGRVHGNTFLLVADATPAQYLWAPVVMSFLLALALMDLGLIARLFRKV